MLLADEQVDWTDMDADGEVLWALTDHLGTVRDVIDNSGTVVDHAQYDAFGNRLNAAAVDLLFGSTGKPFDEATGLQNNLHRWYDPAVGRWVSEDFVWDGTNRYAYVGNASTGFVDNNGLEKTIPLKYPVEIGGVTITEVPSINGQPDFSQWSAGEVPIFSAGDHGFDREEAIKKLSEKSIGYVGDRVSR